MDRPYDRTRLHSHKCSGLSAYSGFAQYVVQKESNIILPYFGLCSLPTIRLKEQVSHEESWELQLQIHIRVPICELKPFWHYARSKFNDYFVILKYWKPKNKWFLFSFLIHSHQDLCRSLWEHASIIHPATFHSSERKWTTHPKETTQHYCLFCLLDSLPRPPHLTLHTSNVVRKH